MVKQNPGRVYYITKIESEADIDRFSYNGVIAAGFVLSRQVETSLIHDTIHDDRCGELIYKTPYGMEGYMDEDDEPSSSPRPGMSRVIYFILMKRDVIFGSDD
ncbi:hypothetical protein P4S72_27305 [Vibrio sp. PP-XX7]